jgi:hypothetical protein
LALPGGACVLVFTHGAGVKTGAKDEKKPVPFAQA